MAEKSTEKREVTIPLGNYLFIQDGTSGRIKTHVGPIVVNLTGNDTPVVYVKGEAGGGKFTTCESLEDAMRPSHVVPEGFYAVLMNPAKVPEGQEQHPTEGGSKAAPELNIGHKIVIQGPKMFALWPGQYAKVIRGHSLRSNQYLIGRVYNEKEARANWGSATITATKATEIPQPEIPGPAPGAKPEAAKVEFVKREPTKSGVLAMPEDLTVGTLFIIKGTDVSFYIPPTGISVVPDRGNTSNAQGGGYTRDAVSLEQLEYCILVDEAGTKRIPRGPAVVFPRPTESFVCGDKGESKYRAIELNDIQGLHIKVTRAYSDEALGKSFKEGDEFFLTGKECPIYFPREEHALVRYDGNTKHFGVAIPSGEARYVMNRATGEIRTVHGPAMLLPNPVNEVIIRRVLTERECQLWYPGNQDALTYNQALSELAKRAPTTRAGVVSEGEAMRATRRDRGERPTKGIAEGGQPMSMNMVAAAMYSSAPSMRSLVSNDSTSAAGDELSRTSSYTAPRTLTLNTKYEGVPRINIWTGFAVMVVDSKGNRRVEQGPKALLLEYDETLEIMSLSTGKPKTTDRLLETPYLRVMHNKVSDLVDVETSDHVTVQMKVSYHVNFLGDKDRQMSWWNVQNYIKHACDHMRSALKGKVRQMSIEDFYANPLGVLRKVVLGEDEKGCAFDQNGMMVTDVELMAVIIPDDGIRGLIVKMQRESVQRALMLTDAEARLAATKQLEGFQIEEQKIKAETELAQRELAIAKLAARLKENLAAIASDLEIAQKNHALKMEQEKLVDLGFERNADRQQQEIDAAIEEARKRQELEIVRFKAEAEALAAKFKVIDGPLSEALLVLSNNETMAKIAQATSVQRILGGEDIVSTLTKMFGGLGLDKVMKLVAERTGSGNNGKAALPAADQPSA
jgi:major vault protein